MARPGLVEAALSAAAIPEQRLGKGRGSSLSEAEQALYRWILIEFASGARPDHSSLEAVAGSLALDLSITLARLAQDDLVHADGDGTIRVAYPFSARPTAHRVRLNGTTEVYAMCAVDALGMASMFQHPVVVESSDPLSGEPIRVELTAESEASWVPEQAVVVAGSADEGAAYRGCCQVLNFFASAETAQQYLDERPNVQGLIVSIPEAVEVGRRIFGDVLST